MTSSNKLLRLCYASLKARRWLVNALVTWHASNKVSIIIGHLQFLSHFILFNDAQFLTNRHSLYSKNIMISFYMLNFGQKYSLLGWTIFEIQQSKKDTISEKLSTHCAFATQEVENSSQWSRDNLIDRLFLLLEFPFSKKFVHVCTLKHF